VIYEMFDGTLRFDTSIDNNGFKSGIGNLGKLADAGLKAVKGLAIASTAAVTAGTVALTKLTKAAYQDMLIMNSLQVV